MTEFTYSVVLFAGEDGLPIEFNIQNTVEKESLKSIIEYGGGMCTLSDEAIYLVSPGTKVLNVDPGKTLISSRYVFDCVKQDCLLDIDEYRIEINEMQTSDFSDNSPVLCENQLVHENNRNFSDDIDDNSIDIVGPNKTSPNLMTCPSSNHDFDFEDSTGRGNDNVCNKQAIPRSNQLSFPLQSSETSRNFSDFLEERNISKVPINALSDSLKNNEQLVDIEQDSVEAEVSNIEANAVIDNEIDNAEENIRDSPVIAVVSSSQPNVDALDQFDNMILNKVQEKPKENEDELSQSCTVSSSADTQVSPKEPSHTSAEIFDGSSAAPDSASQTTERQKYIRNLEREIDQILKKPSPKSIQDKITLVKYICIVRKLAPAVVLQTLHNF